jgi:hypothetical protein
MSDDSLRVTEEFAKNFQLAPEGCPYCLFDHFITELVAKCGVKASDAKAMLASALTSNDDLVRNGGGESVGDVLTPKGLSLSIALS